MWQISFEVLASHRHRVCHCFRVTHWGFIFTFNWGGASCSTSASCLTAFLLLSGETIKIVIEEYVQQLSGYLLNLKFDPVMLFNTQFQYGNRISLEFSQLYHWHPLIPDSFLIDGDEVSYEQFIYNTSFLMHYGMDKVVEAFSRQPAGQVMPPLYVISDYVRFCSAGTICNSSADWRWP